MKRGVRNFRNVMLQGGAKIKFQTRLLFISANMRGKIIRLKIF